MAQYQIDSFTYEFGSGLLPRLADAIADAGGWLLEHRTPSLRSAELHFELHPRAILNLYAALAASGIELGPVAQQTLSALFARRRYLRSAAAPRMLSICLLVRFLDEAPILSVLQSSALMV